MSETYRVYGTQLVIPSAQKGWTFELRPGGWVIASRGEGPMQERLRIALSEVKSRLSASVGGILWAGDVANRRAGAAGAGRSDADLSAQFPGKVRKILVALGDTVVESQPLLLVEAMKMEFAIKAPYAGVIEKIGVAEGQQLQPGDRFLEIKK